MIMSKKPKESNRDKQTEKRSYKHKATALSLLDMCINNPDCKNISDYLKAIRTEVNKI